MLSFLFQVASVKVQTKTSDESHTLLFKKCLYMSEPPYLIRIAFHIAEGYCCQFSILVMPFFPCQ